MCDVLRLFRHYVPASLLAVISVDTLVLLGAMRLVRQFGVWLGEGALWPKALSLTGVVLLTLYLGDLYRADRRFGRRELVARLLLALGASAVLLAAAAFAVPALRFGRLAFVQTFSVFAGGLVLWRLAWSAIGMTARLQTRVLVLGISRAAETIVRLQTRGAQPFSILGFLDDTPAARDKLPSGVELLGKSADLLSLIEELRVDLLLVALPDMRGAFPATDLLECRLRGIRVEDWPTFYEKQTGKIAVTDVRASWLIFSEGFVKTDLARAVKRVLDVLFALAGVALSLPVIGLIALAIKLDSKGPVLFRQARVGQGGRIFILNKFRSMSVDAEQKSGPVWALPDDPRNTRVGRWLRKSRLDELPQLVNVLMADMSFVGPRPERPEFVRLLQRQIPSYMERHTVKPGITGWAQVCHRYAASVDDASEKFQYDLYYIKNLSLFLDLLIVLSTLQVVLFARGSR